MRELERLIERAVALAEGDEIELDDLPPQVRGEYGEVLGPSAAADDTMRGWGSRYARLVFERCGRNKRRTCRMLDISYHTLQAYLRYYEGGHGPIARQIPAWARPAEHAVQDTRGPRRLRGAGGGRCGACRMMGRYFYLARFFVVLRVVPPAMLGAFALVTAVGGAALVIDVDHGIRTVAPVLLLQLFAAASGFCIPARRGHYDLLFTSGESRLSIAVMHWVMSVLPGVCQLVRAGNH